MSSSEFDERQLRQIHERQCRQPCRLRVPTYAQPNSLKCSHYCQKHWLLNLAECKSEYSVPICLLPCIHSSCSSLLVLWSYQLPSDAKCRWQRNWQAANRTRFLPYSNRNVSSLRNAAPLLRHPTTWPHFWYHLDSSGHRVHLTHILPTNDYCRAQDIRKWNHATDRSDQIRICGKYFHAGLPLRAPKYRMCLPRFSARTLLPVQKVNQFRD